MIYKKHAETDKLCKLLLIRHGCTEYNVEKRLQGWTDVPINDLGRTQIEVLIKSIKEYDCWDVIISSDLKRASQTAEIIGEALGIPVFFYKGLRERYYGIYEGELIEKVKILKEREEDSNSMVEPKDIFVKRVLKTFNTILEVFNGQKILIVSHGAVLKNLCKNVIGYDKEKWDNNETVNLIYFNGEWIQCT